MTKLTEALAGSAALVKFEAMYPIAALIEEIIPHSRVISLNMQHDKQSTLIRCNLTFVMTVMTESQDILAHLGNKCGEFFTSQLSILDNTPYDFHTAFNGMSIMERVQKFKTAECTLVTHDLERMMKYLEDRLAWSRYSKQFDKQIEDTLKK